MIDDTIWAQRLQITTLQSVCCSPRREQKRGNNLHLVPPPRFPPVSSSFLSPCSFSSSHFVLVTAFMTLPLCSGDTVLTKGKPRPSQAAWTTRRCRQAARPAFPPACLGAETTGMEKWGDLVKSHVAKPPLVPCFVCLSGHWSLQISLSLSLPRTRDMV